MATAIDVMKYIKAKKRLTGEVQLQKLVYYSQAWSLAWDGAPLFHDKIEAWRHGPVCRSIYKRTDTADATLSRRRSERRWTPSSPTTARCLARP